MGAEADSDAAAYLTRVDEFLTNIDPLRPWYITDHDTGTWAPKMPIPLKHMKIEKKSNSPKNQQFQNRKSEPGNQF